MSIRSVCIRIVKETTAATAVEYCVILAVIVLAMMVALRGVANETIGLWNNISSKSAEAISSN